MKTQRLSTDTRLHLAVTAAIQEFNRPPPLLFVSVKEMDALRRQAPFKVTARACGTYFAGVRLRVLD